MPHHNLKHQVYNRLNSIFVSSGVNKREAKKSGEMKNHIYSRTTLETYKKHCVRFVVWIEKNFPNENIKSLEKCRPYCNEFLKEKRKDGKDYSAWTLKTARAALAKLYGESCQEISCDLPKRRREDIKRSRYKCSTDKSYNPKNHTDAEILGRGAGLRRADFSRVKAKDIFVNEDNMLCVHIDKGKGGKERTALVDPEYAKRVLALKDGKAPNERIIPIGKVPKKLDEHANRRAYAIAMYNHFARPTKTLPDSEKYCCRKDKKGMVFDRVAMDIVSRSLGHGSINSTTHLFIPKVNVIASHYI